jgi:dihydropteroate synthase
MGVLNITPDSFSDAGKNFHAGDAFASAGRMKADGAALLDIGAESTRPGHTPVDETEEIERLRPVIRKISALGLPVSIDTTKSKVAAFALNEGASLINDIWGLQGDPEMALLAGARAVPVIIMHNRKDADASIDIMADMHAFFQRSFIIATAAGIVREKLILDPGIGFGKTFEQNLIALKNLGELKRYHLTILVGASRKSFIGKIISSTPEQRLPGTIAAHLEAVKRGATILRVHDVAEMMQALKVSDAIEHV